MGEISEVTETWDLTDVWYRDSTINFPQVSVDIITPSTAINTLRRLAQIKVLIKDSIYYLHLIPY